MGKTLVHFIHQFKSCQGISMMKRKLEAFIIVMTSLRTNKITVNLDMPGQIETRPNGDIMIIRKPSLLNYCLTKETKQPQLV